MDESAVETLVVLGAVVAWSLSAAWFESVRSRRARRAGLPERSTIPLAYHLLVGIAYLSLLITGPAGGGAGQHVLPTLAVLAVGFDVTFTFLADRHLRSWTLMTIGLATLAITAVHATDAILAGAVHV